MNTRAQFDLHPDAESLNAFAERALGERERDEIMAHLAVCGRCRQVVFLAQEAAGEKMATTGEREEELVLAGTPVAVAPASSAPVPARPERVIAQRPWYRRWWMILAPVGALAAIVALTTTMFVRRAEEKSEMAKNVPAVTLPAQTSGPRAAAAPQKKQEREAAAGRSSGASKRQRQAVAESQGESRALGTAAAVPAPPPAAAQPSSFGVGGASEAREEGFAARSRPEGSIGGVGQEEANSAEAKEKQESAAAENTPVQLQAAPALPSAAESVTVGRADRIEAAPVGATATGSLKVRRGALGAGAPGMFKAKPAELPSGLPAVSTAAAEHEMLGVDGAGNVFLSEDAGVHWTSVTRQWSGRAVAVRSEEIAKKEGAAEAGAAFELVNDQGKVWLSSDGKTWKVK